MKKAAIKEHHLKRTFDKLHDQHVKLIQKQNKNKRVNKKKHTKKQLKAKDTVSMNKREYPLLERIHHIKRNKLPLHLSENNRNTVSKTYKAYQIQNPSITFPVNQLPLESCTMNYLATSICTHRVEALCQVL